MPETEFPETIFVEFWLSVRNAKSYALRVGHPPPLSGREQLGEITLKRRDGQVSSVVIRRDDIEFVGVWACDLRKPLLRFSQQFT